MNSPYTLDIPAVLNDDDNNEDDGNKRACTNLLRNRPYESLSSLSHKTCDHLPSNNAQRTSAASAQADEYESPICVRDQWPVSAQLEANSHNRKLEVVGQWTTDIVVPGDMEDGSPSLLLRSPTEEASDCIYHGGEHGCWKPGHGAISATFSDAAESPPSSAPQMPEYSGSLHRQQWPDVVLIEERKKRRRTSSSPSTNSEPSVAKRVRFFKVGVADPLCLSPISSKRLTGA